MFNAVFFAERKPASILILYLVKNCNPVCGEINTVLSPLSKLTDDPTVAPFNSVIIIFCAADVRLMGTENLTLTAGVRLMFLKGKVATPFIAVDT